MDDQEQVLIKIFEVEDKGPDFHQPELDPVLLPEGVPVDSVDKILGQAEITVLVIVLQRARGQLASRYRSAERSKSNHVYNVINVCLVPNA